MPSLRSLAVSAAFALILPLSLAAQDESWRLAIGLLQRGLPAEAAAQFEAFLDAAPRDPRAAEARYRLGVCRLETGQPEEAVRSFEAALKDRRLELGPECLYRLGGALHGLGRHAAARKRYEELLDAVGHGHYLAAAAHFGAGEALRDAGDDAAAAVHFLAAAQSAPADDPAGYRFSGLYQAGFALLRSGAHDEAARTFEALLAAFPDHDARGELSHLLGEARFRSGDFRAAERAWEAAAELGGDFADDALSGLGWARRQRGDQAGARDAFELLLRRFGDSPLAPAARLEAGRIRLQEGDADAALKTVDPLCSDRDADDATRRAALEVRGLALLDLGRGDDARHALARAADGAVDADARRLRYAIAECDAAAGRFEDALAGYRDAAQVGDAALRGDALYGEVIALHALGRHDESVARARELAGVREHRLAPYAAYAVAENLFALGRHAEARTAFDSLGAEHPLAADARGRAAWCAWLAGDAAGALACFEAVAGDDAQPAPRREEALSMAALAALDSGDADRALALADTYRARYRNGEHVARTERVAARVLQQRGELRAAAERLARAAKATGADGGDRDADGAAIALERADVLLQGGDYKAAARAYDQHRQRPDALGARALEGLAWCAYELGDDADCLRWIGAGAAHPAAGDVAVALGELAVTVQLRQQAWAAAADAARSWLQAYGDRARADEVRYALGVALLRGDDPKAAREVLEPLLASATIARVDLVAYELGWACQKLDDPDAARRAFVAAAERSSDLPLADECRVRAAEIDLAHGEREAARARLAVVEHPTQRARAAFLTAQSWLADDALDGAVARALAAFERVVELGPDEPLYDDALFASGETAHRLADYELANRRLAALLERSPRHPRATRARLLCGECLVRVDQPADAIGVLRGFVSAADAEAPAVRARGHLWLGRAHRQRDEYRAAEAAFARAVELADGDIAAEAQYRIGETRRAAGDVPGAADAFVRVSILYAHEPWVPRGLLEAGRCFDQLGQQDKAVRLWRELVERYGGSDEAKQVAARVRGGQR